MQARIGCWYVWSGWLVCSHWWSQLRRVPVLCACFCFDPRKIVPTKLIIHTHGLSSRFWVFIEMLTPLTAKTIPGAGDSNPWPQSQQPISRAQSQQSMRTFQLELCIPLQTQSHSNITLGVFRSYVSGFCPCAKKIRSNISLLTRAIAQDSSFGCLFYIWVFSTGTRPFKFLLISASS